MTNCACVDGYSPRECTCTRIATSNRNGNINCLIDLPLPCLVMPVIVGQFRAIFEKACRDLKSLLCLEEEQHVLILQTRGLDSIERGWDRHLELGQFQREHLHVQIQFHFRNRPIRSVRLRFLIQLQSSRHRDRLQHCNHCPAQFSNSFIGLP